ncbi:hypothetical protein BGZ76_006349, partial [Entomortierella beljakovae]
MVPANADIDMHPVTPPPTLSASTSDSNHLNEKETSSKPEELITETINHIPKTLESPIKLNGTGGGGSDVINGSNSKDHLASAQPSPQKSERKSKKREESHSEREQARIQKRHLQMNDSLLLNHDEDQEMEHDGRQPTDEKYKRLKRKLKEVLE